MTPRKELFIKTKEALMTIPELELVDFYRNQFSDSKDNYPDIWTAALIKINAIQWQSMTEGIQEGNASIDITLYCKDGWMDQHSGTSDPEHGLIEIDLMDLIAEKLHGLKGDYFKPLDLTDDEPDKEEADVLSFRLSFSTVLYRRLNYGYKKVKLTHT